MRKTNLFYTTGSDSKFLTFSNYTESLTGNFISTNTKLYPSMFLCLKIDKLDEDGTKKISEEAKKDFINNYLIAYYENKLACLRDDIIYNNENPENWISPLSYLLKTIEDYDPNFTIPYVGDITEQDFNGTYTDIICIVDVSKFKSGNVVNDKSDVEDTKVLRISEEYKDNKSWDINILHGWSEKELKSWFNNQNVSVPTPRYDKDDCEYDYYEGNPYALATMLNGENHDVEFNVIIPLFDVVDFNYNTNETILSKDIPDKIDLRSSSKYGDSYRKYVPLGIWFADTNVTLTRDKNTGFSQSWSLVITSQFKPFPYAKMQPNNVNDLSMSNAFPTFAMILSRQNDVLDQFEKMQSLVIEQNKRIATLEAKVNNSDTAYGIDKIKKDFIDSKYEMTSKFNNFKQEIYDYMDNLRWKGAE